MSTSFNHQLFGSTDRVSLTLCNDRCQNILYKAVFEHFIDTKWIAALLLASKSFQNSSFGANFLVNFAVDYYSIRLLDSVLSPSSCFSLQFVPSIHVKQSANRAPKIINGTINYLRQMVTTKYLNLSLRSLTLDSVTNEVLSCFFGNSRQTWPQLRDLTVESCELHDTVLEIISNVAVHLRTANLSRNGGITNSGLDHLVKLSSITVLDLSHDNITDAGLASLSNLANITSFDLSWCDRITNDGFEHLSKLSKITSLNLFGCNLITDVGLEHLSKLSSITSLDLQWCKKITDVGLEHLVKLSSITSLNLSYCGMITDDGLGHLSKLSSIISLFLSYCFTVTDVGLERISSLSRITSLDLNHCNLITDEGLRHVSNLTTITALTFSGCTAISDAGLEHVAKLSNAATLNLRYCRKVTAEATKKLKTKLPHCNIFS